MPSPPLLPSKQVVIYNCLSGDIHHLGRQPLSFGATSQCDIQLGSLGFKGGRMQLSHSGKQLQLTVEQGNHHLEIDGAPFDGGLLPLKQEFSLVIDKMAFFFIRTGEDAIKWGEQIKSTPAKSWQLRVFEGGLKQFNRWQEEDSPKVYPNSPVLDNYSLQELFDEVGKRNWDIPIGVVKHCRARSGFFANQFSGLAKPDQIPDAGENRCPRCWMRFDTGKILAIHPSEIGDEVLGENENKRFLPSNFDRNSSPLTPDSRPCPRLACPHCRGELPPNFLQKPPHLFSIVGDGGAGKSYFLTVAINQLQQTLRKGLGVSFTDGDTKGNDALSQMIARLFSPTEDPKETYLNKTWLTGATYKEFRRYGRMVKLPAPFTYNLTSRERGAASMVFYDNAGEHFRPGLADEEKSNYTDHISWASGIIFLFDPLQHSKLLLEIDPSLDPQITNMKENAAKLRFDQHVILMEIHERLKNNHQVMFGQTLDIPLAIVVGKHDLLDSMLPREELKKDLFINAAVSKETIDWNSNRTQAFLEEYCPEIVAAAETISEKTKYFPASSFGMPAVQLDGIKDQNGQPMYGPKPSRMHPYLVEAPLLWLLSEIEPELVPIR
jgi:hypothetical protein